MFFIRLDDASDKRNMDKWNKIEALLDEYQIKPLVGVIPNNQDKDFSDYPVDDNFWGRVKEWEKKGWTIAVHGWNHVFLTENGGLNPVNTRSEFAGVPLEEQKKKIRNAIKVFHEKGVEPRVFFAPAHTFDENTLIALKEESNIRVISDTISNRPYYKYGFTFVPQQSGRVRRLPFHTVTFCYHPNNMNEDDFRELRSFIHKHRNRFADYSIKETKRKRSALDRLIACAYFLRRGKK